MLRTDLLQINAKTTSRSATADVQLVLEDIELHIVFDGAFDLQMGPRS